MSLWGLCLLGAVGAVYGFLVGGLTFPYGIGLMFSGPIFGTASGLCVGPLEGLVLWGCPMSPRTGSLLSSLQYPSFKVSSMASVGSWSFLSTISGCVPLSAISRMLTAALMRACSGAPLSCMTSISVLTASSA